jgi:hypothetical protein
MHHHVLQGREGCTSIRAGRQDAAAADDVIEANPLCLAGAGVDIPKASVVAGFATDVLGTVEALHFQSNRLLQGIRDLP